MTYDVSRPPQQRVVFALVRCGDCVVPTYYTLDHKKVYNVLVPSFIADGGDNYTMLKAVKEWTSLCKSRVYLFQASVEINLNVKVFLKFRRGMIDLVYERPIAI